MILIEGRDIEFYGYKLFVTRQLKCVFCLHAGTSDESPVVSFANESEKGAIVRMNAQLHICTHHLRELAQEAETALATQS